MARQSVEHLISSCFFACKLRVTISKNRTKAKNNFLQLNTYKTGIKLNLFALGRNLKVLLRYLII
jgi:hypothetical protein